MQARTPAIAMPLLLLLLIDAIAACGGGSGSNGRQAGNTTGPPAAQPTPAASAGPGAAGTGGAATASLTFSHAVQGDLGPGVLDSVVCPAPRAVTVQGTLGSKHYTFSIAADATGGQRFYGEHVVSPSVALTESANGQDVRRWSNDEFLNGTATIAADGRSGSIDAEVGPVLGATDGVHVKGTWSC